MICGYKRRESNYLLAPARRTPPRGGDAGGAGGDVLAFYGTGGVS